MPHKLCELCPLLCGERWDHCLVEPYGARDPPCRHVGVFALQDRARVELVALECTGERVDMRLGLRAIECGHVTDRFLEAGVDRGNLLVGQGKLFREPREVPTSPVVGARVLRMSLVPDPEVPLDFSDELLALLEVDRRVQLVD